MSETVVSWNLFCIMCFLARFLANQQRVRPGGVYNGPSTSIHFMLSQLLHMVLLRDLRQKLSRFTRSHTVFDNTAAYLSDGFSLWIWHSLVEHGQYYTHCRKTNVLSPWTENTQSVLTSILEVLLKEKRDKQSGVFISCHHQRRTPLISIRK